MIRALIVDDSEVARSELRHIFYADNEIEVIDEARDGIEAEQKILTLMPQVVLVDLVMPRLDGIGLIRRIRSRHDIMTPVFILLSNAASDQTIKRAFDSGASYYYLRPFEEEEIICAIKDTFISNKRLFEYNRILGEDVEKFGSCRNCGKNRKNIYTSDISNILHTYGITSGIKGYHYLRRAIEIVCEKDSTAKGISKEIYYDIANEFDTTYGSVERNIRYAIENGFKNNNASLPEELNILKSGERRMKNFQFIDSVADYLKNS